MKSLLIRGGAVGDFVLTLPVLDALRAADPEGRTEILGNPAIASLAATPDGNVRAVARVGDARFAPLFSESGGLGREESDYFASFDLVVCVWPDKDGVIRRNLNQACSGRVVAIDPTPTGRHAVDHMLAQAAEAGLPLVHRVPKVALSERERSWAKEWAAREELRPPLLAMHIGSGGHRKNWPLERFAEVAKAWARRGGSVAVTVGPVEEEAGAVRSMDWGQPPPIFIEGQPLRRVAAGLAQCDAYLGNDSGITHLAAAVGAPTVALFGPTDPRLWAPRGRRVRVVEDAMESEPADIYRLVWDFATSAGGV